MDPATLLTIGTTTISTGGALFGDPRASGETQTTGEILDPVENETSPVNRTITGSGSNYLPYILIGGVALILLMR